MVTPIPDFSTAPVEKSHPLKKVASQFEGIFLRMLLQQMMPREEGGLFGKGPSAGMVRGMFVDQVGEALTGRGALGIASLLEKQLARESENEKNSETLQEVYG